MKNKSEMRNKRANKIKRHKFSSSGVKGIAKSYLWLHNWRSLLCLWYILCDSLMLLWQKDSNTAAGCKQKSGLMMQLCHMWHLINIGLKCQLQSKGVPFWYWFVASPPLSLLLSVPFLPASLVWGSKKPRMLKKIIIILIKIVWKWYKWRLLVIKWRP